MKHSISLFLLVLLAVSLSACDMPSLGGETVRGNGTVVTETRSVGEFTSISLSGTGQLTIKQGEKVSVNITADENLLPYLLTEVNDNTLDLKTENGININTSHGIKYAIVVPDLNSITISGLGSADIGEFTTETFKVEISGSGNVTLENIQTVSLDVTISGLGSCKVEDGSAMNLDVNISGSGDFDGRAFSTTNADASISSLGSATFNVEQKLNADISGSGSINYYGNPNVTSSITGLGDLNRRDD